MKTLTNKLVRILLLLLAITPLFNQFSFAQKQGVAKVTIGDPAPPLNYSKWIQGSKPIKILDSNRTYVIEFWATWCVPCIQAMPHLSELAKKYKGKIDFIGCNVLEHVGKKPYESAIPAVEKFVSNQKKLGRMTYNVIADNNAENMSKGWLDAAGIDGIPSSFVISKGVVAWIGHPLRLDSVLNAIETGTFDIQVVKRKYEGSSNKNEEFAKQFQSVQKLYQTAETEKNFTRALSYTDSAIAKMPEIKYVFMKDKFRILLDYFGEDRAIEYGNEVMKGTIGVAALTGYLAGKNDLSKKMKMFSVLIAKKMTIKYPMEMEVVAKLEARAGLYKEASESQQKTIDMAIEQKKNPEMANYITDDLINGYKKSLEEYKNKAK